MTAPTIPYNVAVAVLRESGAIASENGDRLTADCPVCNQAMRVDGRPGRAARFSCYGGTPEEDVVAELLNRAPLRDGPAGEAALRFRSPEEVRAARPKGFDFVWESFLARRSVTLLSGKPKGGKSTLTLALVEAMVTGATTFLGRPLVPGPVVYVSEEDSATLRDKLPPDGTPLRLLPRDEAWPKPPWEAVVDAAVAEAERVDAVLLVADTLRFWSDLGKEEEKDAGATGRMMRPLLAAASRGLAVLAVHHQRKAAGDEGDAVSGSSAIVGAVDASVELERVANAAGNQRQLVTLARWPAPGLLLVDRDKTTRSWRVVAEGDDRTESEGLAWRDRLLGALPADPPGASQDELHEFLGEDRRKWSPTLSGLVADGLVVKIGKGVKGSPLTYYRPPAECRPRGRAEMVADQIPPSYGEGRNLLIRPRLLRRCQAV